MVQSLLEKRNMGVGVGVGGGGPKTKHLRHT